jgi:hypothetical protein
MIKRLFYLILISLLFGHVPFAWGADRGEILSGETKVGLNIVSPSYMDTWTFNGQAGYRVIITAIPTSGNLDTYLILYPPGGGAAEAEPAAFWYDWIDHQLEKSGTYTILVKDYELKKSGTYNINLLKIPGAVSSPEDPDGGPIASGETLSGTIDAPSDRDAFQFYGEAGDRVIITCLPTSGNLDTYLTLYYDGDPIEAQPAAFWYDWIDHQLQKTGLYTIVVNDYELNKTGTYNINFLKIPGAFSSPEDLDGGLITSLNNPSGEMSGTIDVFSDRDAFLFYGQEGDRVIISCVPTSGNLDTYLTLYPPDGGPIEAQPDAFWYDWIDHELEKTGLYTIVVNDYELNETGTYNISLTKIPSELRPGIYNPSPQVGEIGCDSSGSFSWDPADGAIGYDLYFGENVIEPLVKIGDNLPDPFMPFPPIECGKIYYWHVVAHTSGDDVEGPYWWFEVACIPNISVDPPLLDFGSVPIGNTSPAQTVTISNTCTADLIIGVLRIEGKNASEFSIQTENCSGHTISQSGQCSVDIVFTPHSTGQKNANLLISSNDPDQSSFSVPVSGTGTLDISPPTPNPMTWAKTPYPTGATSVSMIATTASDPAPPINYYFDYVDSPTGGTGGTDSGWQSGTSYTNSGLQPNHQYRYRVKARDSAPARNETSYSSIAYTYTLASVPGTDFFTNVTKDCIRANWTANGNPSGTEYFSENTTTTATTSSGWTTNTFWDSCNLACSTTYSFRVKSRNGDGIETDWRSLGDQWTQSCNTGLSIFLQFPAFGEAFNSCSLISKYQPIFTWTTAETFTRFTIFFSTSPTNFSTRGLLLAKANIPGSRNSWIPAITLWKTMMKSSDNNGTIRSIYWKVVGTKFDNTTSDSEVRAFHIGAPQPVTINTFLDGAILQPTPPPTFNFDSRCNIKFRVEFSPLRDFSDPKKIVGFIFTTKDPNMEPVMNRTLTPQQWIAVRQLIGTGTGYFRIKAWDGIKRETVSIDVMSFSIESSLIGTWDIRGRETITVTLQGRGPQIRTVSFYDEFIFYPDGTFQMIGVSGTWTQLGSLFTIYLPYDEIEKYFEEAFRNQGYNVDVTVTSISFTGRENWIADIISGKIIMAMNIYIYNYGLPGTVKVNGTFTGRRQGAQISILETRASEGSKSFAEAIGTELNETIQSLGIELVR